MSDDIKDIVIPILQTIQGDISTLKSDVAVLKESVVRIDARCQRRSKFPPFTGVKVHHFDVAEGCP